MDEINKKMNLISMKDFVLSKQNLQGYFERLKALESIKKYAEFLDLKINLSMFEPCDENGEIIKTPYYADGINKIENYKKAKSKVLFKGFNFIRRVNNCEQLPYFRFDKNFEWWNVYEHWRVEDLILEFKDTIELTSSAITIFENE